MDSQSAEKQKPLDNYSLNVNVISVKVSPKPKPGFFENRKAFRISLKRSKMLNDVTEEHVTTRRVMTANEYTSPRNVVSK